MVRDMIDRHTKLRRGDSKTDNLIKISNTDSSSFYLKVIEYEEQEALSREGDQDSKLFKETCEKFKEIIKKVGDLKSNNDSEHSNLISDHRVTGSVLFVKMKKINRIEKFRLNNARDKLYDTKRQVDNLHLQWQNLLYETHHLKKEISKCLSYKSRDEHIELIPVEDFYKSAPQSISRPEITKNDPHQLQLARLEWELSQRKMLAETYYDLEEEKEQIASEIKRKKSRIGNLVPMIKNILAVTKPVQEHLSLPMSQIQNEPELGQLLPPPLYFFSIQVDALREACNPLIKLSIVGDKETAGRFNCNISDLTIIEDSDSEEEIKNHHHRRKTKSQIREEKIKKLLTKHPLSVNTHVQLKDGNTMFVLFNYLINLRIITVMPSVKLIKEYDGLCCRYLLEPRNLLNGLFDRDYGDQSPNVTNNYQLQRLGIEFNTLELGVPYLWAQKLCGLDFTGRTLGTVFTVDPKTNSEQRNMSNTVDKIRKHFEVLLSLCEQMHDLENLVMPILGRDMASIPVKMACTLLKWNLLTWQQITKNSNMQNLISVLNLNEHDSYFEGIFVRNTAKLSAITIIRPDYPNSACIFSLQIENGGKKYNAQNNNNVRDIEKEVNYYVDELLEKLEKNYRNWILTAQLYRVAICFDIFLECTDRENFTREKLLFYHVRGRARTLPFKYIKQGSEGIFVQR